jgi:hypothetical protein
MHCICCNKGAGIAESRRFRDRGAHGSTSNRADDIGAGDAVRSGRERVLARLTDDVRPPESVNASQ